MSTVDVLIPHFESVEGLRLSLETVAAQTWTGDLRIVVADDGSSPDAFARVEAAVAATGKAMGAETVVLRHARNRGRPFTRNALLDAVDSPYVAWLDAGDIWYPRKLELQFEQINRLRLAGEPVERYWITCDYDWRWVGAKERRTSQDIEGDQIRALLMGKTLRAYLWTILAPAASLRWTGRFDEKLPRLQDLDYFIRFAAAGGRIDKPRTKLPLCLYDKSDLGRDAVQIRACNARIAAKHQPLHLRYGYRFERMRRYEAELHSARFARNNGAGRLCAWYLARAFRAHPALAARQWITQGIRL